MGTRSPRRRPASFPTPSVADLSTAAHEHRCPCSPDDDDGGDDFELTPLLPRPRRGARAECPRTASGALTKPPPQRARRTPQQAAAKASAPGARRVRWHEMAFGSVRVPSAMDVRDIRRRLQARRRGEEPAAPAAGWAPWRLIRSLSCKGVEAVAVAAAAAPVRLV